MLLLVAALCSCATRRNRAIQLSAEAYNLYWGDWQKVVEVTTRAIATDPDFAWPYYQRGVAHSALGEEEKALKDLDTAIEIEPDIAEAYADRASILMERGDYDKAELDLKAALSLDPYDPKTLVFLVELNSIRNNTGTACMFLRRAVNSGFNDLSYLQLNENFKNLMDEECVFELFPGNR
jgi:tetratricopeptide (TPR) repeat protein